MKGDNQVKFNINKKALVILASILIIIYMSSSFLVETTGDIEYMTYGEFLETIESSEVESITSSLNTVSGELKDGTRFQFNKPITDFDMELAEKGFNVEVVNLDSFGNRVGSMIRSLLFLGITLVSMGYFIVFIMKKATKGQTEALNIDLVAETSSDVTFDDVAGNHEAKEELIGLIDFIKTPHLFKRYGAKAPKGTLLTGPPGNGKTLMAKALAGEAGVPFISVSGSDFVQMYVGVGAGRIRDLFRKAKSMAPCIIFIDEIDALGRKRAGGNSSSASDERDQTLNQLLVEMDGFNSSSGVLILAATNRPELLDDALLRPGRFDRQINVTLPDVKARREILEIHSKGKPLNKDVDLDSVARMTIYMSGADLANVMNEASIYAAKSGLKGINMNDIDKAINKVLVGEERKHMAISTKEKEITAYHEAGHALVAKVKAQKNVPRVTIIPTTKGAGGYTLISPEEKMYETKKDMLDEISIALGGRIAEEMIFGEEYISSGAGQDLKVVTRIAERMIKDYGMSKKIGLVNIHELYKDSYSGSTNDFVIKEIKNIVENIYQETKNFMEENRVILIDIAKALLERETLYEEELDRIIKGIELREDGKEEVTEIKEDRGSIAIEEFFREKIIG